MNSRSKHTKILQKVERNKKAKLAQEEDNVVAANNEYRQIFADIRSLERLIEKYQLNRIIETESLNNMVGKEKDFSKCSIEVIFNVTSSSQKPNPKVKFLNISMVLNYEFNKNKDKTHDTFSKYGFNLAIKGYNKETDQDKKYFCWHLDREPQTDGRFIHPLYHFHAGGSLMSNKVDEAYDDFVISSPRLAHPPMDVILSIHFLIQNFINGNEIKEKIELLSDDDYINIIERAQKRVLDPYFDSISDKTKQYEDYNKSNLFPLYVCIK